MLSRTGLGCRAGASFGRLGSRRHPQARHGHRYLAERHKLRNHARVHRRIWQAVHNKTHKATSRRGTQCYALTATGSADGSWDEDGTLVQEMDRQQCLLKFVQHISPECVEVFRFRESARVVNAMQQQVTYLLGNLPPCFEITHATKTENLAELMKQCMYNGHAFRNAEQILDRRDSLWAAGCPSYDGWQQPASLPIMTVTEHNQHNMFTYGSDMSSVSGQVRRWHPEQGEVVVDAAEYIKRLEDENRILRQQVATLVYVHGTGNELLEFMHTQPYDAFRVLHYVSEESVEAMSAFIHRLLGTDFISHQDQSHYTKDECQWLLSFALVVGYLLRQEEQTITIEQTFRSSPGLGSHDGGEMENAT